MSVLFSTRIRSVSIFINVDLPEPDGPYKITISPSLIFISSFDVRVNGLSFSDSSKYRIANGLILRFSIL